MPDEPTSKTTLRLPADLLKRAKIFAIKNEMSFQDLVIEALKTYLKGERQ